jgi:flagellar basal body P-ring protein FlgI
LAKSFIKVMKRLFTLLILIAGVGTTASAQKVKVGADPSVDFSKYKTYAWSEGMVAANPMINQLILQTIDEALTAKGLTRVSKDPDVTLAAFAALNSNLHISYPTWGRSVSSATASGVASSEQNVAVSKGSLVVDIADARTKTTVWRGSATQTLSEPPTGISAKDAKNVENHIRKAVDKMFKQFPPAK